MNHPARVVIGASLIALGAVALLGTADVVDAGRLISRWWPLVIVFLGLAQYLADPDAWLGALVVTFIGLLLLGTRTEVLAGSVWGWVWPLGLIALGISIVVARLRPEDSADPARVRTAAIFSSREVATGSEAFEGADLTAVFGAAKLDLTNARLTPGARITATILLGSVEIFVPHGWRITLAGTPILGSWDDTTRRDGIPADAPELTVRSLVILGGIEVRHVERWA